MEAEIVHEGYGERALVYPKMLRALDTPAVDQQEGAEA